MIKEKLLPISIVCLSISIIISASILEKGMIRNGEYAGTGLGQIGTGLNTIGANLNPNNVNQGIPKDNFSLDEAAGYLGISQDRLIELVDNKGSGIPYLKMADQYVFNKNALEKWLEKAQIEIP